MEIEINEDPGLHQVDGHIREYADGSTTWVDEHVRTNPDGDIKNNLS